MDRTAAIMGVICGTMITAIAMATKKISNPGIKNSIFLYTSF
jgi:hypothetical protein